MRYDFIRFLRLINGIPEGAFNPLWITVIYHILFPVQWWFYKVTGVQYEARYDTYVIRGIRLTGEVFEMFKGEVGSRFEVVKSVDGLVTIRRAGEIQLPMHEN